MKLSSAIKHLVFCLLDVNVWKVPIPIPVIPIATGVSEFAFSADDASLTVLLLSLII